MKRALSVFLCLCILAAGAAGCKVKDNTRGEEGDAAGSTLKIAIVTSPSGVDDGTFNQEIYSGIQSFIKGYPGASVKAVQETTGDTSAAVQAVADIAADYDVVVCCGFQFAGITETAGASPDTKFILVDSNPASADGGEVQAENIYGMTFAEQESGFFAGMAAALESKTKKAAVINGIAYPSNVNYQYGFESGINYANKKYGAGVEVIELPSYSGTDVAGENTGGNYVGSFNDQATGKVLGNTLIKEGCDILFVVAGGSGAGVFTAAKEAAGVMVIGCDTDQYDEGASGSKNIVLTSAVKNMGKNVEKELEKIAAGGFQGKNELRKADSDSTGYIKTEGRNQLSPETMEKLDAAYELVKDGTIVPASNFNGISPEDFPGINS